MSTIDDELKDQINRAIKIANYFDIIKKHGFFDDQEKCLNETLRIFETIPIIFERIGKLDPNTSIISDEIYDIIKFLANLMTFSDAMKPIADKYNPSEDMKRQFVEFLKSHPLPDNKIDQMCQEWIEKEEDDNDNKSED